jgi:hypothetical protein
VMPYPAREQLLQFDGHLGCRAKRPADARSCSECWLQRTSVNPQPRAVLQYLVERTASGYTCGRAGGMIGALEESRQAQCRVTRLGAAPQRSDRSSSSSRPCNKLTQRVICCGVTPPLVFSRVGGQ